MIKNIFKKVREIPTFIKEHDLEELLFIKRFGIPEKKAKFLHLRKNNFIDLPAPIFFLSTGRCGTNWFVHLLKTVKGLRVFHEPKPNLGIQGVMIYDYFINNNYTLDERTKDIFKEIIYIAREQYFRYSYKTNNRYVETNNQITFFAQILAEMFPQAKFIHIYRHPGEFVRSALRRNFYSNDNVDDMKRIKPIQAALYFDKWKDFSPLEKASWLWNETNSFIERFKNSVGKTRCYSFNFSNISVDEIVPLLDFVDVQIPRKKIAKKISKRINVQIKKKFPLYNDWKDSDKILLKKHCNDLASKYGYKL